MRETLRKWLLGSPHEALEAELWATIEHLHELLCEAEADGGRFLPGATQARAMLKAIGRR
jgi:hypothetical protein